MGVLIFWLVGLAIYFIPTFCANYLEHRNTAAIFILNLLLGWTLLGWVGALVWAFTESKEAR